MFGVLYRWPGPQLGLSASDRETASRSAPQASANALTVARWKAHCARVVGWQLKSARGYADGAS